MKRILKYSVVLSLLLVGLLSCELNDSPNADYQINGTVTDSISGSVLPGIQVVLYCAERTPMNDTVKTDSKGKYDFSFNHSPFLVPTFTLTFVDVDGELNQGDFETRRIETQITSSDWVDEGDDYNYYGKAVKIINVKMFRKAK